MHFTYLLNIDIDIDIAIFCKYRIDILSKLKKWYKSITRSGAADNDRRPSSKLTALDTGDQASNYHLQSLTYRCLLPLSAISTTILETMTVNQKCTNLHCRLTIIPTCHRVTPRHFENKKAFCLKHIWPNTNILTCILGAIGAFALYNFLDLMRFSAIQCWNKLPHRETAGCHVYTIYLLNIF